MGKQQGLSVHDRLYLDLHQMVFGGLLHRSAVSTQFFTAQVDREVEADRFVVPSSSVHRDQEVQATILYTLWELLHHLLEKRAEWR